MISGVDLYTLASYRELLWAIAEAGYRAVTLREYLKGLVEPPLVILRHDVEWSAGRALDLAELELAQGFRSTLYFRADTSAFDLSMRSLQDKGFEIGYHYNTLDRCGGDFEKAIALFESELSRMREAGLCVETVCSHGDPRVKKKGYRANYEIFVRDPGLKVRSKLLGEAYLDVDFSSLRYLSDAGIRWNVATSTGELISKVRRREWPVIYMLTHPDYWSRSPLRALGLQVAARGMRLFKVNSLIIAGKETWAGVRKYRR